MPKGLQGFQKNQVFTEQHRTKLRLAAKVRRLSEVSKRKISESLKGRTPYQMTEEIKKKISKSLMGKKSNRVYEKLSEEHKKKFNYKGKKHTDFFKKIMSEKMRGKNNHQWNGGITPLTKQIRRSFKYRQWRSDVFTRDNFTCQKCEARSGKGITVFLEAHHYPKSFKEIFNEYNIKSFEQSLICEELWNINNGISLCLKCHNKTKPGRNKIL